MRVLCFLVMMLLAFSNATNATHLVGADFTYSYIGQTSNGVKIYRFELYLYRDCKDGDPKALQSDDTARFGLYNYDINNFVWRDSFYRKSEGIVPTGFVNACVTNIPSVCLSQMKFQFDLAIPNNINGYMMLYQRCCRNEAQNMNNAGGSSVGSTYFVTVNPSLGSNNSAVFKNYPPQIICINNAINYDHGAIDPDGDSLSYAFCDAFDSPPGITNPYTVDLSGPGTFGTIPYSVGFSGAQPMVGSPAITIDPITGLINGKPTLQGRFVVTVCCTEWRNNVIVGTVRRDFQFVVTNCSKVVVADIASLPDFPSVAAIQCSSYEVQFSNTSTGGYAYYWDFGVPGTTADTSNLMNPSFVYPDTGTYTVKLIVNRGSTCPDSIEKIVKVYPFFNANFSFEGAPCKDSVISFTDLSTSTLSPPNYWLWNFGDLTTSTEQNPKHSYAFNGGTFPVTLIAKNNLGCRDTVTKSVTIESNSVSTNQDTIVLVNTPFQLFATGAATYNWVPPTNMDDATSSSPTFNFAEPGTYVYEVQGATKNGCRSNDSITIYVVKDLDFYVPNAFTPNGDGINDYAKIIQAGYGRLDYFRIYDRFGNLVFTTNSFRQFWNGTAKGQLCDQGVYFWMARARNINNEDRVFKGDITLLR